MVDESKLELWKERDARLRKALNYETVDRVPVIFTGSAWAPASQSMRFSRYCTDPDAAFHVTLDALDSLEGLDGVNQAGGGLITAHLTNAWLSRVKVPGIDLPCDVLWQVEENETMKVEDYDLILNKGWEAFLAHIAPKVHNQELLQRSEEWLAANATSMAQRFFDRGYAALSCMTTSIPFEALCGARSMEKFYFDCYRMPDKVKAVLDVGQSYYVNQATYGTRIVGVPGTWVGGWRTASAMISPRIWDRLVFPYLHDMITRLHAEGIRCVLHFDQNWDRDIKRFLEFPKGCIFSPDGSTNIRRAKEILGDHMVFTGDVPSALLATGTPNDVFRYARDLIRDLGAVGLIMNSGCDVPFNAPRENVQAMIAATY
jgi:uroporphyrinogen-III decarboxylase